MKSIFVCLPLTLLCAALSNAAIIVFNDQTGAQAYSVATATGTSTAVAGSAAWGAAYDPGTSTLYWNDGSQLMSAAGYTGGALAPTSTLAVTYGGNSFDVTGLAFDTVNSKLIGFRSIGTEGFYEIDVNTGQASLVAATPTSADFGGIDFDPLTGYLYGTNDEGGLDGHGLYRISDLYGSPTYTLLAPYPGGITDIDGLATGAGIAYLILDQAGQIYVHDLVSNSPLGPLTSPITGGGLFAAGAYIPDGGAPEIPEPATLLLAGFALTIGVMLRRRAA